MCGRYTLTSAPAKVAEHFGLDAEQTAGLRARYNIAPGQDVPMVRGASGAHRLLALRFGLELFAPAGAPPRPSPINARIETVTVQPAFREALFNRRGLVPADGYFEWRRRTGGPEPHWVSFPDRALFAFAGLCHEYDGEGSFAILTRPARGPIRALHDRMPVVISPRDYERWLDPGWYDLDGPLALCESALSDGFAFRPVDPRMNDVRFDDPACIAPSPQLAWF